MTTSAADSACPLDRFAQLPEAKWNALARETGPFVDWRFLASLEQAGCIGGNGWNTCISLVGDAAAPRAAAPAFIKSHSHGEFVFDWAWAHGAQAAGLRWYPKLLVAAPFSPVTGPRLLGSEQHPAAALELVRDLEARVHERSLSSAGINFCSDSDAAVLREAGWLERHDWQFHWTNPGYRDFDDFLSRLRHKPRKNIRAERRRVKQQGWQFEWKTGEALTDADIDLADRCYQSTFALYGNLPSLNRHFFELCARRFGRDFLLCVASQHDEPLAAAIFWRDAQRLYGRYWGSLVDSRDVHFEACYYQGIDYCIHNGLKWFEPGAQGEHKIRRGFLPTRTRSFHYIRHPGLRRAIANWLVHEKEALGRYRQHLDTLDPFTR
ncbi:GNAT family N-acetyltransferase [Wenzhouxiangella sp. AB-CW3]|uniref:GNAT family N-acetyltransferase n=1 Tax=Wenzhouxiangella sp. AB-CW3 TaxID=2771012 RepID=UPI00168B67E5|nr:GNAT family N-acetyltransferase [Wenzhouxiangella sp. AB-CW3]QOC21142.1 GNAT family N-acetyltransferase [Wenzhouxiangella sp. AB-CW3]